MSLDRIAKLQSDLTNDQALYVTNLINVRYLCGFSGSNGALLITADSATLATDSRYEIQSAKQVHNANVLIGRNLAQLLLGSANPSHVSFEGENLTVNQLEQLHQSFPDISFTPTTNLISQMRITKDANEISHIKAACEISTQALADVLKTISIGQTEKQVRDALDSRMRALGADDIAFTTIVASGPNSAIPHHEPSDRKLRQGDFLKIDFGAKVAGYHADCTRTFVLGKAADWQLDLHKAVVSAQSAGRSALRADALFTSVETAVAESLAASGYLEFFTHGLGHGVGLEIHEEPYFSRAQESKIGANTVITVEPGAYLPERGGVRIEDTVVVTEIGYENLTNFSYELIEI